MRQSAHACTMSAGDGGKGHSDKESKRHIGSLGGTRGNGMLRTPKTEALMAEATKGVFVTLERVMMITAGCDSSSNGCPICTEGGGGGNKRR